jgi:hypothetical protein
MPGRVIACRAFCPGCAGFRREMRACSQARSVPCVMGVCTTGCASMSGHTLSITARRLFRSWWNACTRAPWCSVIVALSAVLSVISFPAGGSGGSAGTLTGRALRCLPSGLTPMESSMRSSLWEPIETPRPVLPCAWSHAGSVASTLAL